MKASFNATALEMQATGPAIETWPRYLQAHKDGSESLLDGAYRPIWWRPARGVEAQPVTQNSKLPRATAIRDLWTKGVSPKHCHAAAWEVSGVMRRWGLCE